MKPWGLNYIPPKHLRVPGYNYGKAEDSCEEQMARIREKINVQRKSLSNACEEPFRTTVEGSSLAASTGKTMLVSDQCGATYRVGSSSNLMAMGEPAAGIDMCSEALVVLK
ncbi:hypothetical protein CYMTET_31171 [Cymbomonas tetramitiformis]|uniref:Uncharacterized protein n=1 Tax=Cymbomonas tetramitiformis TaxID=36881 RepID=A0AAE0KT83_9CHLO|nr:hypothetical protein CYMTET_31171 [Cymbomonas tetramitiformis]